jgi:hypothetical protein
MCLGDIRLMPWVVGRSVLVTANTNYTKALPENPTRVGLLFSNPSSDAVLVWLDQVQPQSGAGIYIASTGQPLSPFTFHTLGRVVQLPVWVKSTTGTPTLLITEFTTRQDVLEYVRQIGLKREFDVRF